LRAHFDETPRRHPAKFLAVAQRLFRADALSTAAVRPDLSTRGCSGGRSQRPRLPRVIQFDGLDVKVRRAFRLTFRRPLAASDVKPTSSISRRFRRIYGTCEERVTVQTTVGDVCDSDRRALRVPKQHLLRVPQDFGRRNRGRSGTEGEMFERVFRRRRRRGSVANDLVNAVLKTIYNVCLLE